MWTEQERKFVEYWETNRLKKKKIFRQLSVGLPLSVTLVFAIAVNFFSGWYKRADMEIRSQSSLVLLVVIAGVLIVVFMTVFSAKHKWDMNEQRYRELMSKKEE
jgi:membrane protein YdbS with pleckstrin-like domain